MTTTRTHDPALEYQRFYGPAIFEPLCEVLLAAAPPRPGERVLDVASGTGIVTRAAAARVAPGGSALGVDLNPAMVRVAAAQPSPDGAAVTYRRGDAVHLTDGEAEVEQGAFDLVLCQQGLQFFPDRSAALAQMHTAASATGRLGLAVWQGLDVHPLFRSLAEAELPHLADLGVDVGFDDLVAPFSFGDADVLLAEVERAGFREPALSTATIHARFPGADTFVERLELAYAAVVPRFAEDPEAFARYLTAISDDTRATVATYVHGNDVVVPMHTNIVVASA